MFVNVRMNPRQWAIIARTMTTLPPAASRVQTLLYIEDDAASLRLVEKIVERLPDIRLLTAVSGHGGLEIAGASRPDAILMDINLSDISGYKALKVLRSDPNTAHIPVIALSGNALPMNIESGLEAGFFRYLTKPLKVDEFMNVVGMAMELAGKHAARST